MSLQVLLGLAGFEVWRKPVSRKYGRWEKELRKVEFALLGHIEGEECSQESRVKSQPWKGEKLRSCLILSYPVGNAGKMSIRITTKNYPSTYHIILQKPCYS
jgi:hypothetical protein